MLNTSTRKEVEVEQKPSVGRTVHYCSPGNTRDESLSSCRAAIVTDVHEPSGNVASLAIFNPTGIQFRELVAEGDQPYTWHWPERV